MMKAEEPVLKIEDFVDLQLLQRLQDSFAEAMGVAAVAVNRDGVPITETSNFCTVCQMIRSTEVGLARCQKCDADGGRIAHEQGQPYAYKCYGGLLDAAAPIIIDGQYMGCILCGQVIPTDEEEEFIADVLARNLPLGLPAEEFEEALRALTPLPRERFEAAVEMLSLTANHIVEKAMSALTQSQLLREAQERTALQAVLQETQLKALKAQINPHFLFNSLTLLAYTALEENASHTEEIAYTLSDLLRYSLRNMSTSVELSEEMEMIERYLAIQKIRFGDRLESEIVLDPELRHFQIPCMILQPLVENAVIHGVEPLIRPAKISVKAYEFNGRLVLEVADNGCGMPDHVLALLESGRFDGGGGSLGLPMVFQRLESEYQGRFVVEVRSAPEQGTQIYLTIALPQDAAQPAEFESETRMPLAPGIGNQINLNQLPTPERMPFFLQRREEGRVANDSIILTSFQ
jgi:ligand-binding sensor protein/two-component sensor histidine kinase